MALIAERWGLIPELKSFAKEGRPIWGTCAGLIFLADRASGAISAWAFLKPISPALCMQPLTTTQHKRAAAPYPVRFFAVLNSIARGVFKSLRHAPVEQGRRRGGQALLGGLDCSVHRNFFGAQMNSFETQLSVPADLPAFSCRPSGTTQAHALPSC